MRRPSWNKSQAIQQVISLKALLEPNDFGHSSVSSPPDHQKTFRFSSSSPRSPDLLLPTSVSLPPSKYRSPSRHTLVTIGLSFSVVITSAGAEEGAECRWRIPFSAEERSTGRDRRRVCQVEFLDIFFKQTISSICLVLLSVLSTCRSFYLSTQRF